MKLTNKTFRLHSCSFQLTSTAEAETETEPLSLFDDTVGDTTIFAADTIEPVPENPCADVVAACGANARCETTTILNRVQCTCVDGYAGAPPSVACEYVYPCASSPCHSGAICTDLSTTEHSCECGAGLIGDGTSACDGEFLISVLLLG